MVRLYFMYYNFGHVVHQTLRVTPAMEAGIANQVWSIEEIVAAAVGEEHAQAAFDHRVGSLIV